MRATTILKQIVLFGLLSILWTGCSQNENESAEPVIASIGKEGKLYSNFTLKESGRSPRKYYCEPIGTVKPRQRIRVMETGGWEKYKVLFDDGSMGWIDAELIKPSKKTYVKHNETGGNQHIASNRGAVGAQRKIVKEVTEKTAVTRLEEYREVKSNDYVINWTKVRTEDDIEGWIMSDYLYRVVMEPFRSIQRKTWRYDMDRFEKKWKDKSITDLTKKYKEASAIQKTDTMDVYYFNNILLFKDNDKKFGVKVFVNNGIVESVDAGAQKTDFASYMPLSSTFRINFIANQLGNWNYIFDQTENPDQKTYNISDHLPKWANIIVVILIILVMLAVLYAVLSVPFLLVNKLTYRKSLDRKLFNRRIMLYATFGSIVLGYAFYLLMVMNVYPFCDYFWVTSLFCLGMILGNISKWRNDLDYKRCNAASCHQWTGEHVWTEYLGGSTVTQTVRYSNGATQTNQQTTRRYRDYRKCSACNNEWSIVRTEVFGGLKI